MSLVWIHEGAMTLNHTAVVAAGPSARPIFIWDTEDHDRRGYTLKRRVFIYECALALNIPIFAGRAYDVLAQLSEEGVDDGITIYAAGSPDPYIRDVLSDLSETQDVKIFDAPRLAEIPANTDTGRFFRFWNRARKSALTQSQDNLAQNNLSKDNLSKDNLVS